MTTKKRILIGVGVFLLAIAGIGVWIAQRMNQIMENKELTEQIPSYIIDLFSETSADDYPYVPQEVVWDKRYLILDGNASKDFYYNKQRNTDLDTHQYFPDGSINGLVLIKDGSKHLGYYKKRENDADLTGQEAYQKYYAISYFDLKQACIVARDTVWGPEPKKQKRGGESQHGSGINPLEHLPSESDLVAVIQNRVK